MGRQTNRTYQQTGVDVGVECFPISKRQEEASITQHAGPLETGNGNFSKNDLGFICLHGD